MVRNKLLLTLIGMLRCLPEFGDMAELPSKSQGKFVAYHQRYPVQSQLPSVKGDSHWE